MQIQMTRHWQGANGHIIKPAIYEANDPALLNMAAYLVENGYAIALDPATPSEDTTIETLVELSHDEPAAVPTVKPSKLHKPQSKR